MGHRGIPSAQLLFIRGYESLEYGRGKEKKRFSQKGKGG